MAKYTPGSQFSCGVMKFAREPAVILDYSEQS